MIEVVNYNHNFLINLLFQYYIFQILAYSYYNIPFWFVLLSFL